MISIYCILKAVWLELAKEEFLSVASRYQHLDWMKLIKRYSVYTLNNMILYNWAGSDYEPGKDPNRVPMNFFTEPEYLGIINKHKNMLTIEDYLFLKAQFDNSNSLRFLEMAQLVKPENLRYELLQSFFRIENSYFSRNQERLLYQLPPNYLSKRALDYLMVLRIVRIPANQETPENIIKCLNELGLDVQFKVILLYSIMLNCAPQKAYTILKGINFKPVRNSLFRMVCFMVYMHIDDFNNAGKWIFSSVEKLPKIDEDTSLQFEYQLFRYYRFTGNEGKAILTLNNIVFDESNSGLFFDEYMYAISELAKYYIGLKDILKTSYVFSKLDEFDVNTMDKCKNHFFFNLKAEKSVFENNIAEAVECYNKAYMFSGIDYYMARFLEMKHKLSK